METICDVKINKPLFENLEPQFTIQIKIFPVVIFVKTKCRVSIRDLMKKRTTKGRRDLKKKYLYLYCMLWWSKFRVNGRLTVPFCSIVFH